MYSSYEHIDWENRSEWLLIADKLEELALHISKAPISGKVNGVQDTRLTDRLIENTRSLAQHYRAFSEIVVSR